MTSRARFRDCLSACLLLMACSLPGAASSAPQGELRLLGKHPFVTGAPHGGPADPAASPYTLANLGDAELRWQATTDAAWLDLVPASGVLQPGESASLIAQVDQTVVASLAPAHYTRAIRFLDRTNQSEAASVAAELWVGVQVENHAWLRVNGKKLFPIYVWQEPPTASWVDYFQGLGINIYLRNGWVPPESSNAQLLDLLEQRGMYAFLRLDSAVADHRALIGWTLSDEPVHNGYSQSQLQNEYAAVRAVDPYRPVLLNFGSKFYWDQNFGSSAYESSFFHFTPIPEIVSFDFYPVTGWNKPQWVYINGAATEFMLDHYLDYQKPVWALVEASDQNLSWTPPETPGPSPAQMRFEVWDAILHGATGIGYFTHAFNPHEWAPLTPEIEAEMIRTNAQIRALTEVLLSTPPQLSVNASEQNARAFDYTLRRRGRDIFLLSANADMLYRSERVTYRFPLPIVSVDVYGEGRTITPQGDSFSDDYQPLEVHIYRVRL